jgi:hypothetical protein
LATRRVSNGMDHGTTCTFRTIIPFGCTIIGYTFVACTDHLQLIQYVRSILKQIVHQTTNYRRGNKLGKRIGEKTT